MRKLTITLSLSIFYLFKIYAGPVDSLKALVPNLTGKAKVEAILELCAYLPSFETETLVTNALRLSEQIDYTEGSAHAYLYLGINAIERYSPDSAIYYLKNAETLYLALDPKDANNQISETYTNLIVAYLQKEDLDNALLYAQIAHDHDVWRKDSIGIGNSYINFSDIYSHLVNPEKELNSLHNALSIYQRCEAPQQHIAQNFLLLGEYHLYQSLEFDSALYYLQLCETMADQSIEGYNFEHLLYYSRDGIAEVLFEKGKFQQAAAICSANVIHYDTTGRLYDKTFPLLTLAKINAAFG